MTNTNQLNEKIEEDAKRYMRSGEFTPFIIQKNMASLSPNIYVLQYLTNTNQLTEKIEEDAKRYMRSGEFTPFIIL